MSDDTPTQRFDQPVPPPRDDEEKKSRGLLITLIVIGAVLLVAIIVILLLLLGRNTGTNAAATGSPSPTATSPSPSPTPTVSSPSPTPSASASKTTAPPPPPSNNPVITSFTINPPNSTVVCNTQSPTPSHQYLAITWKSTNGVVAYFAVGKTDNAKDNGEGWTLPPNGNQNDFPNNSTNPFEYGCPEPSRDYTITIEGTNGKFVSKTVTVTNKGDTH